MELTKKSVRKPRKVVEEENDDPVLVKRLEREGRVLVKRAGGNETTDGVPRLMRFGKKAKKLKHLKSSTTTSTTASPTSKPSGDSQHSSPKPKEVPTSAKPTPDTSTTKKPDPSSSPKPVVDPTTTVHPSNADAITTMTTTTTTTHTPTTTGRLEKETEKPKFDQRNEETTSLDHVLAGLNGWLRFLEKYGHTLNMEEVGEALVTFDRIIKKLNQLKPLFFYVRAYEDKLARRAYLGGSDYH